MSLGRRPPATRVRAWGRLLVRRAGPQTPKTSERLTPYRTPIMLLAQREKSRGLGRSPRSYRGQPGPLRVIPQDAFVLLLLFLQDPDLLLEVLELETPILVLLTA